MPGFTYIHYDGADEKILELVSRLLANANSGTQPSTTANSHAGNPPSAWDQIARQFTQHVATAAAYGNPGQKNAMTAWLKEDGEILLSKLWKASGVKAQHDYSGVGGSLTKNMMKAKGPKAWYTFAATGNRDWVYKILPELVEPLKRSFGLK